jgi:hypothetical protein
MLQPRQDHSTTGKQHGQGPVCLATTSMCHFHCAKRVASRPLSGWGKRKGVPAPFLGFTNLS